MLSGFSMDSKRVTVTVETCCVPLFMVGVIKGLFELETGNEKTTHDWDRAENGDHRIEIKSAV